MQSRPNDSPQIRLLTLNIFLRPPYIQDHGNDYKDERLHFFAREYLPHYDVICFQELFDDMNTRKYEMIELAQKCGFKYHAASDAPSLYDCKQFGCGGLLTISKYSILKTDFHAFS